MVFRRRDTCPSAICSQSREDNLRTRGVLLAILATASHCRASDIAPDARLPSLVSRDQFRGEDARLFVCQSSGAPTSTSILLGKPAGRGARPNRIAPSGGWTWLRPEPARALEGGVQGGSRFRTPGPRSDPVPELLPAFRGGSTRTRKSGSADEKFQVVLRGLQPRANVAEIYRRHGISSTAFSLKECAAPRPTYRSWVRHPYASQTV